MALSHDVDLLIIHDTKSNLNKKAANFSREFGSCAFFDFIKIAVSPKLLTRIQQ